MELHLKETHIYQDNQFILKEIRINGTKYEVIIRSDYRNNGLSFEFVNNKGIVEFGIGLTDVVTLTRHVYRPNHDHDDIDNFYVLEDGKSYWSDDFPHNKEVKGIKFGSEKDDY